MWLTRVSVAQPVFAAMVMLAITVLGLVSFSRLAIEQFPDVDFPVVAVVVSYPGASPEAVEADIVEPIEESVATIAGIDSFQSTARTGQALVLMFFDLDITSADAAQDVRDRIAAVQAAFPGRGRGPDDPAL
jgi:HAE1 family hydrophobic/amphiphilic exporter-1